MVKVIVKQVDIREGVAGSTAKCPIARALQRTLRDTQYYMGVYNIHWNGNGQHKKWVPAKKVQMFRKRFDEGQVVKPFSFQFNPNRPTSITAC